MDKLLSFAYTFFLALLGQYSVLYQRIYIIYDDRDVSFQTLRRGGPFDLVNNSCFQHGHYTTSLVILSRAITYYIYAVYT